MKHCNGIAGVDDGLLAWCCRKGIARISLEHVGNTRITGAGILGFCFGGKDPGDYTRYLHLLGDDYLEEDFFDKLIEVSIFQRFLLELREPAALAMMKLPSLISIRTRNLLRVPGNLPSRARNKATRTGRNLHGASGYLFHGSRIPTRRS